MFDVKTAHHVTDLYFFSPEHPRGHSYFHRERHRPGPGGRRQRALLLPAPFQLLCHRQWPWHRVRDPGAGLRGHPGLPAPGECHGECPLPAAALELLSAVYFIALPWQIFFRAHPAFSARRGVGGCSVWVVSGCTFQQHLTRVGGFCRKGTSSWWVMDPVQIIHRIIEWFGSGTFRTILFQPRPTSPGCPRLHPARPGALPGMEPRPQLP